MLNILIPVLANNLFSTRMDVRNATEKVLNVLCSSVESTSLLPHFASVTLSGNPKVQIPMLEKIIGTIHSIQAF